MIRPYLVALLALLLLSLKAWSQPLETRIAVYSEPSCTVLNQNRETIGKSGKPFILSLPEEPDAQVELILLTEDGFEKKISHSAKEWKDIDRIPADGRLSLNKGSTISPFFLGIPILVVVGYVLARNRRQAEAERPPKVAGEAFQLGEEIGEGASSKIYRGRFQGKTVAIKILKTETGSDEQNRARLERSLKRTLSLNHPNLVRLLSSGRTESGDTFLIMELLKGQTLETYLEKNPLPDDEQALEILSSLCQVLSYLHRQDINHRDVKPENIFLTDTGEIKLMDLEISKDGAAEDLTKTGVGVGTPFYIAPEQAQGNPCLASDQYSVGVIFYEILTGHKPYAHENPLEIIRAHIMDPIPSLKTHRPDISNLPEAVVRKMMAKRPDNRFADLVEAEAAIKEALSGSQGDDGTDYTDMTV